MKLYLKQNNITFGDEDSNTQIENEIKLIDKMVEEYDKLNKKDKAGLLMHFYTVYLNDKDFIKFINDKEKKHFSEITPIHTKMEDDYIVSEGHGRDFSWWTVKRRYILQCTTTKDFVLEGKKYSYDELIKLYEEGKIYPLYFISKEINSFSEDKEEPKSINCFVSNEINVEKDNKGYKLLSLKSKYVNAFLKLVDKNYNNSEIISGIKEYTQELIEEFLRYESESEIEPQLTKLYNKLNKK